MHTITCHALEHRGEERLFISCPRDTMLNTLLKKIPGLLWSQTKKKWYLPLNKDSYQRLCMAVKGSALVDSEQLKGWLEKRKQEATTPETPPPPAAAPVKNTTRTAARKPAPKSKAT